LHPQAFVVDVGVDIDSLDDVASGYVDAIGLFDDVAQGEAEGAVTPREELEGVSVVVNGGAGFQIVFLHDDFGAGPLEKGLLDQEAGGVFTDFAKALVACEVLFLGFEDLCCALGDGGLLGAG
jgi:hypothetical protein